MLSYAKVVLWYTNNNGFLETTDALIWKWLHIVQMSGTSW